MVLRRDAMIAKDFAFHTLLFNRIIPPIFNVVRLLAGELYFFVFLAGHPGEPTTEPPRRFFSIPIRCE